MSAARLGAKPIRCLVLLLLIPLGFQLQYLRVSRKAHNRNHMSLDDGTATTHTWIREKYPHQLGHANMQYDISGPRVQVLQERNCSIPPWMNKDSAHNIPNDTKSYFYNDHPKRCFIEGTSRITSKRCECRHGWNGKFCSIPDSAWFSDIPARYLSSGPRFDNPRRIIHAFPFNIEFDMLDARFAELADIVDVFLILESNYTAYGTPKPLYLLDRLKQGHYNSTSCRIVHVFLDYFPTGAEKDGWISDRLHRNYLSQQGLRKQLKGFSSEDLFVLTDADEIPSRNSLTFLKLHDRYPQPVGIMYHTSVYGFFWHGTQLVHKLPFAVTIGILTRVLNGQAMSIRSGTTHIASATSRLNAYLKAYPHTVIDLWFLGNESHPAGWHCSWCFSPMGIRNKLLSAQNGDFPRWGDYPEKLDLGYIRHLIRTGSWFDNQSTFNERAQTRAGYAPKYFLSHPEIYKSILKNGYK